MDWIGMIYNDKAFYGKNRLIWFGIYWYEISTDCDKSHWIGMQCDGFLSKWLDCYGFEWIGMEWYGW